MFGWRWARFKQRMRTLTIAFLATFMSAGFVIGILGNATAGDAASIALFTVPLSLLIWMWGFYFSRTWLYGADMVFFSLAPMTPRRFFLRKIRYHRILYIYMLVFLPFSTWLILLGSRAQPSLTYVAGFLAYYVMMLGPIAEGSASLRSPTLALFIPRHIVRIGIKPAIGVAVAAGVALYLFPHELTGAMREGLSRLFDLGPAGYVITAAVSPASAVGALTVPGTATVNGIAVCAFLGGLLLWEAYAIARTVLESQPANEQRQLDAWLEYRAVWLEHVNEATDIEEKQIENWTAQRTHARIDDIVPPPLPLVDVDSVPTPELENSNPLEYSPSMPTEAQIIRHAKYALKQVQRPGISGVFRRMTAQYWILTLIVGFQVARLAMKADVSSLPAVIALGIVFFRGVVAANSGHWWEPMLRLNIGVPVRVRVLMVRAFADHFAVEFLLDAGVVALAMKLSGAPWWIGAILLVGLQLIRASSYLRMWLRLSRGKGRIKDVTLYQGLELVLYCVVLIGLVFDSTERGVRRLSFDPTLYVAFLAAGGFVILTGIMSLWWRYRRADTSHMRNSLANWGE